MTIIANPIYDAVFKYLMEDKKVATILLSALLKKEIVELEMRRHEYTSMEQTRISLFRIDFSAKVREADGSEHLILIELQKTWLTTETLRFRQYLGTQYLNKENVIEAKNDHGAKRTYGLPIISIYILGHALGDLTEPVIYVRRRYLDYDDNPLQAPDRFIESLTHDSIIVQIPFLSGRTRNHLERMLGVFDQEYCRPDSEHYLEIDEDHFEGDAQHVVHRLLKAAVAPDIRRAMEVEDEILSEIEDRDTTIMMKDQEIEEMDRVIQQKDQEVEEKNRAIQQKDQEIEEIAQAIQQKEQQLQQMEHLIRGMVKKLWQEGASVDEIAQQLQLTTAQVEAYIAS